MTARTRHFLLLLGFGGLALACFQQRQEQAEAHERPWSVQLHVHGSYSEGKGSMEWHAHEAAAVGCDVLWWSDHDFRIGSLHHATTFGFDAAREQHPGYEAPFDTWIDSEPERERARGTLEFVPDAAHGTHAARLVAKGGGSRRSGYVAYSLNSERSLFKRPLGSGIELHVRLRAEDLAHGQAIVRVTLSEHSASGDVTPTVVYYTTSEERESARREWELRVPLLVQGADWHHLVLPVTRDVVAGFPEFDGRDNSLYSLAFGLEVAAGQEASVLFDDLRIVQEVRGQAAFERQAQLIRDVAEQSPAVEHLQGVELSAVQWHLNEFSAEPRLLDYAGLLAEWNELPEPRALDLSEWATLRSVEAVHARRGLVSLNHVFGAAFEGGAGRRTVEEVLERLTSLRVFGVDLLEVGYRERGGHDLADHLSVWDELARRGFPLVGTGVSDSHGSTHPWRVGPNNFVSWIWAPSTSRADLLAGLRAGRVFFGDRTLFDGALDLESARGARMGQVVVTDRESAHVVARVSGLQPGDELAWVVDGVTRSGPTGESLEVPLSEDGAFVRVEGHGPEPRGAFAFSNGIHFVRELPAGGLAAERVALDLGGFRSSELGGFRVGAVRLERSGARAELVLDIEEARAGSLRCAAPLAPGDLSFEGGLAGVHAESTRIELEGSGRLRIRLGGADGD